jgi:hypothetical protein
VNETKMDAPPERPVATLVGDRSGRRHAAAGDWVDQWIRSPEFLDAVLPTLGIRLALLVFAPIAVIMLGDAGARAGVPLNLWNAWDAPHYLEVARLGYDTTGDPARAVIFPLLPLLLRAGSVFLPGLIAGLLISVVATVAAAVGIYRLARLDGASRPVARAAVLAMSIFPTSFALVPPYSEPLFIALVVWSFLRARRADWVGAGILGMLAGLTRLPGVFVLPALLLELRGRSRNPSMLGLLLIGLAPIIYLGINWWAYGDPLFFLGVQQRVFAVQTVLPWAAIGNLVSSVATLGGDSFWATVYVAPLLALLLLAVILAWTLLSRRGRGSYFVYAGLSLLSFASLSWPISVPRYILGVFPLFLMLGGLARSRFGTPLAVASILVLGLFTTEFALGRWAF